MTTGPSAPSSPSPPRRLADRLRSALALERRPLAIRLAAIVLALAVPLNLIILAVVWHLAAAADSAQRTGLLYTARSIAAAVDAQLDKHVTLAQALAREPTLLDDDLSAFETKARRVYEPIPDAWVLVADTAGQQLLNLAAAPGQPLPRRAAEGIAAQNRAFETRSPVISGVWRGLIIQNWVATIEVPIFKNDQPFRTLTVFMTVQGFAALLNAQQLPSGWLAGIATRDGRFITRVPDHSRHVGQLASAGWRKIIDQEGLFEFPSLEGDDIVQANTHTRLAGWAVGVAVRKTELVSVAWTTIRWAMLFGGGVSVLSLVVATAMARRITGSITDLRGAASALMTGSSVQFKPASPEIGEMWNALQRAAAERAHLEVARRQFAERFRSIYDHAPIGIVIADQDGRLLQCNQAFSELVGYSEHELRGMHFSSLIHPDDRDRDVAQGNRLRAGEIPSLEIESRYVCKNGQPVWVRKIISTLPDETGKPAQVVGLALDITERKRADEKIDVLMHELNHRSKNLLGLVQTIATQTARSGSDDFAKTFSERIQALGASQDLLVKSQWQGVDLEALVRSQLAHFKDLIGQRITLEGPPLRLAAAAAQPIGMALHELATNAAKYGALSNNTGRVDITWQSGAAASDSFNLNWTERDGPPVSPPRGHGFGTTLIEAIPRRQLGCHVTLDFAPEGLRWHVICPVGGIVEPSGFEGPGSAP